MNLKSLSKHYNRITAEERFQLIMAASSRNDVSERDRLVSAGAPIKIQWQDHAPYAQAFDETAHLIYLEVLDAMCEFLTAFDQAMLKSRCDDSDDECEGDAMATANESGDKRPKRKRSRPATDEHYLDYAMAAGHIFRTKWNGWLLFCQRQNIPPLLLWETFPACDRLKRAVAFSEKASFTSEGFVRWMNRTLAKGRPPIRTSPMTAEVIANEIEMIHQDRLNWWTSRGEV